MSLFQLAGMCPDGHLSPPILMPILNQTVGPPAMTNVGRNLTFFWVSLFSSFNWMESGQGSLSSPYYRKNCKLMSLGGFHQSSKRQANRRRKKLALTFLAWMAEGERLIGIHQCGAFLTAVLTGHLPIIVAQVEREKKRFSSTGFCSRRCTNRRQAAESCHAEKPLHFDSIHWNY